MCLGRRWDQGCPNLGLNPTRQLGAFTSHESEQLSAWKRACMSLSSSCLWFCVLKMFQQSQDCRTKGFNTNRKRSRDGSRLAVLLWAGGSSTTSSGDEASCPSEHCPGEESTLQSPDGNGTPAADISLLPKPVKLLCFAELSAGLYFWG